MGRTNCFLQSDLLSRPQPYSLPPGQMHVNAQPEGAGSETGILVKGSLAFDPFPYREGCFLFPKLARGIYLEQKARRMATHFAVSVFVLQLMCVCE